MQRIDDVMQNKRSESLTNQSSKHDRELKTNINPQVEVAMTIVWKQMAGRKGPSWWKQNFGSTTEDSFFSWCFCVNDLNEQQILKGLERSMNDSSYPTAEKFRAHCLGSNDSGVISEEMYKPFVSHTRRLTSDEAIKKRNELGKKWITKLKEHLN